MLSECCSPPSLHFGHQGGDCFPKCKGGTEDGDDAAIWEALYLVPPDHEMPSVNVVAVDDRRLLRVDDKPMLLQLFL